VHILALCDSFMPTSLFISAFHLSYNMLLNQMRSEDGDPEQLLRHSFYQFQADRALPDLEVS
jgi:superfamily II RNA helicase